MIGALMQNDEQEIRELIATWLSATKAGDAEKVLSLMADDVVFLICGQPPMRGKAAFAASLSALSQVMIDATSEIQEIKVLGEWAYTWTHLSVVITPKNGGASVTRAGNTLSILQKQNGSWLMLRDANMLAPVAS
ncbi:MAG TPA: SgcJ/EcaC family oxidoreductase [Pyrinomonadaceae bacterium]|nr:SgcJ/EcaC family oxidoreductase [Pyrinomonadaceae bacterium]